MSKKQFKRIPFWNQKCGIALGQNEITSLNASTYLLTPLLEWCVSLKANDSFRWFAPASISTRMNSFSTHQIPQNRTIIIWRSTIVPICLERTKEFLILSISLSVFATKLIVNRLFYACMVQFGKGEKWMWFSIEKGRNSLRSFFLYCNLCCAKVFYYLLYG